jgi:hypothetical protein
VHTDKLGKIAMRVISAAIFVAILAVLADKQVDGFPFGVWGLIGAITLGIVAFLVGQVE